MALAVAVLFVGGCNMSRDRQVIRSTPNEPMSVAVIDTVAQRTLWAMEVPIGHELRLDFRHGRDRLGMRLAEGPPTRMRWRLSRIEGFRVDRDLVDGPRRGRIDLPEAAVRVEAEPRERSPVSAAGSTQPEG